MYSLIRLFAFSSIFMICSVSFVHASDYIAKVEEVVGSVSLQSSGKKSAEALKVGAELDVGDKILTTEGGFAKIAFSDDTTIVLNGADGVFSIDDYVFDDGNADHNRARFDVKRASFIFVSGKLGKTEEPDVEIGLDFGTIGIRGTKIRRAMKDGECWILLEQGKIRVKNKKGSVLLREGDGTRLSSLSESPARPKPWSAKKVDWIVKETMLPGADVEQASVKIDEAVEGKVEPLKQDVIEGEKSALVDEEPPAKNLLEGVPEVSPATEEKIQADDGGFGEMAPKELVVGF